MNLTPEETKSTSALSQENKPARVPEPDPSAEKTTVKKRTWKKPKDKPKRPLSAYNIFFQHQRSRIVEGYTVEATPEDIIRSIEAILSKSREKRRHRKTHGRISFGDLARAIADQWKSINAKNKTIFDHYAEVDMLRYRREVKVWKDKKEMENEANAMAKHSNFINSMNSSFSSSGSGSELNLDSLPDESNQREPWNAPRISTNQESFNSSYSSVDSNNSAFSLEPEPIQTMIHRQQQILQQQLRESNPHFMGTTMNASRGQTPYAMPGAAAFHSSFSSLPGGMTNMQPYGQHMGQHMGQHASPMGHASFSNMQIQQGHQSFGNMPRQTQQAVFHNTWQEQAKGQSSISSLALGDALQAPSNHVSDYSSSHHTHASNHTSGSYSGFASSQSSGFNASLSPSSGFHASDGLIPPSSFHIANEQIQQQEIRFANSPYENMLQQQQESDGTRGGISTMEHDLGGMDLDRSGNFGR